MSMTFRTTWTVSSGSALLLLGLAVIAGWATHQPALVHVLPASHGMPYATAVGFLISGLLLLAAGTPSRSAESRRRPWVIVLAALSVLLGLGVLLEWYAGVRLGLSPDPEAVRQWFADTNPYAGKMRPLAAVAFMAIGLAALLIERQLGPWSAFAAEALALLVLLIGLLGVAGHTAGFGDVITWLLGPVLTASIGFVVAASALWLAAREHAGSGADASSRIGLSAGAIVIVTGLAGIFGGFAVLYPETARELQDKLLISLRSRGEALDAAVGQAWLDSRRFANQPLQLAAMSRLNRDHHDEQARREVAAVAEQYRTIGLSAVVFRDAASREVARAGSFVTDPELRVEVTTPSPSELLWSHGYVLHTRIDMIENGRKVGVMEAERRLPLDARLHDTARFGASLDFVVCTAVAGKLDCFPFRSAGWRVLRQVPAEYRGQPLPMSYALAGKTGIVQTTDYRGVVVIAAHMPLDMLGLGAVLKIDAADFYQPVSQRVVPLLMLLLLVAGGAVLALRLQVVPLARTMQREIDERQRAEARLAESEGRLIEITTTLGEGVCVIDEHGVITFANPEAEQLLGFAAGELLGRDGYSTFRPPGADGNRLSRDDCPLCQAIAGGMPFRNLDDWLTRKDGSPLPVSIIARPIQRDGRYKGAVISFTDVAERKRLEETQARLASSLHRLAEIAAQSHLPLIEQLRRALAIGADHLQLEFGIVSHVEGDSYRVVAQVSPPNTLQDGQTFAFGATYCSITLTQDGVVAISHIATSPHATHPCYREFKLEAYIGTAISVGGKIYGTVNFSSPKAYDREFDDTDREFVTLLARWAASAIERDLSGAAIRQRERRMRALLDASPESTFLLAPSGLVLATNQIAAERLSTVPRELVGRNFFDYMPPELAASRRVDLDRVIAAGAALRTNDRRGSIEFENTIVPVVDDAGTVEAIAVYARDITEQQRAQRIDAMFHRLDLMQLKWRMGIAAIVQSFCDEVQPLFGLAAAWIARADKDGSLSIIARTEPPGPNGVAAPAPQLRWQEPATCPSASAALRSGQMQTVVIGDPQHPCGGTLAAGAAAGRILPLTVAGEAWGILALYADDGGLFEQPGIPPRLTTIANRLCVSLEACLQQDRLTLLDAALSAAGNAVFITDAAGNIIEANSSLSRLTGYPAAEILGKTPRIFSSGEYDAAFYREFWRTIASGQTWQGEFVNARPDGTRYTVSQTVTPLRDADERISHYVSILEDISEKKAIEARIAHMANFDALTDLPNRTMLFDRLTQALALARRDGNTAALLFLDLDRFKEVNDTLGHDAGDLLLCDVAQRLRTQVRETDTVARLAGDEFTVVLPHIADPGDALRVADKIIAAIALPFELKGREVTIGVSIGVALYPAHGDDVEQLVIAADKAMYAAKQGGRNTHCLARPA